MIIGTPIALVLGLVVVPFLMCVYLENICSLQRASCIFRFIFSLITYPINFAIIIILLPIAIVLSPFYGILYLYWYLKERKRRTIRY